MKVPPFELERWQSVWENQVEINISESGVLPLTANELLPDETALRALLNTPLGYPQTNGSEETRACVAALYPGASAANVLMTTGCAEANFLITWALLEPGDEAVFMVPNYMQVGLLAASLGANVRELRLREDLRWGFDPDELRRLISKRTRLIAICNPNNPTGAVMSEAAMKAVCERAAEVGAWILADEVYRGAEFSGELTPPSGVAMSECCALEDCQRPTRCLACAPDGLLPRQKWPSACGATTTTQLSDPRC